MRHRGGGALSQPEGRQDDIGRHRRTIQEIESDAVVVARVSIVEIQTPAIPPGKRAKTGLQVDKQAVPVRHILKIRIDEIGGAHRRSLGDQHPSITSQVGHDPGAGTVGARWVWQKIVVYRGTEVRRNLQPLDCLSARRQAAQQQQSERRNWQ